MNTENMIQKHLVVLDTDIGTDVDDAMALAVIFGTEAIDLLGVTTVYGNTLLRSQLAQRYAGLTGREIDTVPGARETLSGKEVWWPGHEGSLHDVLDREPVNAGMEAHLFLTTAAKNGAGKLQVIAIGPLTNIALAIQNDSEFATNIGHLWIMGGAFDREASEHNFRSDCAAAESVFNSGIPITVVPLDVTELIHITKPQLDEIGKSGRLGAALLADIEQWWRFWEVEWNVPHDPIAVLALTDPDFFELSEPGLVFIEQGGANTGASRFEPEPDGNVRVVRDMNKKAVADLMVASIVRGSSAPIPSAV